MLQVHGLKDALEERIEAENSGRKFCYGANAIINFIFWLVCGAIYLAHLTNARDINRAMCKE